MKKVAPNPYFSKVGRTTVKCDFCESSKVSTTTFSSFATILHLAQSTPRHLLRCALDTRAMVERKIAQLDAPVIDGGVEAPTKPGLGVTPELSQIGDPIATYGASS